MISLKNKFYERLFTQIKMLFLRRRFFFIYIDSIKYKALFYEMNLCKYVFQLITKRYLKHSRFFYLIYKKRFKIISKFYCGAMACNKVREKYARIWGKANI